MARLIVHVLFIIVLAVLIGFNISNRVSVNVFGTNLENVSMVVVLLVSFVVGALYALYAFFTYSVGRRRRAKQKGRTLENRQREQQLNEREKDMDTLDRIRRARKEGSEPSGRIDGVPDSP